MFRFINKHLSVSQIVDSSQLRLGRYCDAYKTVDQRKAWEFAEFHFSQGKYLKSFQHFLSFLLDPYEENISRITDSRDGTISFELFQGSRRISGLFTKDYCEAQTILGYSTQWPEALLKELLETNYSLHHCGYAFDAEDRLVLRMACQAREADPHKLYSGLNELALEADRQDDLITSQYQGVESQIEQHVRALPLDQVNHSVSWLRREITNLKGRYDVEKSSKGFKVLGFSYVLLDLVYRIEYLLTPQARMRMSLGKIHRNLFDMQGMDLAGRLEESVREIYQYREMDEAEIQKEFYQVVTTFGLSESISLLRWQQILRQQLEYINVFGEDANQKYACHIPGYIMGYSVYRFALPGFFRDLIGLYYILTSPDWAKGMGYPALGFYGNKGPDRRGIVKTIRQLVKDWSDRYEFETFDLNQLKFDNEMALGQSWLQLMATTEIKER